MFGFKLVRENNYNIEKELYNMTVDENRKLRAAIKNEVEFKQKMKNKIESVGAIIYGLKYDKDNVPTFICVRDNRAMYTYNESKTTYLKEDVVIFTLNANMNLLPYLGKYNDVPFLVASFKENSVSIDDIHSDIENKGYATMLIETLIKIAKKSGYSYISGELSAKDAEIEEKKNTRNMFYLKRGFKLSFNDEQQKTGRVIYNLK